MSRDYCIKITLKTEFSREAIVKILAKGAQLQFTYYDFVSIYPRRLNADEAATEILLGKKDDLTIGSRVYALIKDDTSVIVGFHTETNALLSLYINGFGNPQCKEYYLDSGHYVPLFLSLCKDFNVTKIETEADW